MESLDWQPSYTVVFGRVMSSEQTVGSACSTSALIHYLLSGQGELRSCCRHDGWKHQPTISFPKFVNGLS